MPKQICDLCKDKPARYGMENKVNGNKIKVCISCYKEIWGK